MENDIPKIVHFCWFGEKEKPKSVKRNIDNWKKVLPDYEIIEWNEDKFDLFGACDYVKEAVSAKKWAFVSDYVRLYALYGCGGIYLDTDVQVLKSFDDYLQNDMFLSHESESSFCTAVIGAKKGNSIILDFMNIYENTHFVVRNKLNLLPNSVRIKSFLEELFQQSIVYDDEYASSVCHIYPRNIFCGKDIHTHTVDKTENTVTIHHLDASWYSHKRKFLRKCKKLVIRIKNFLTPQKGN